MSDNDARIAEIHARLDALMDEEEALFDELTRLGDTTYDVSGVDPERIRETLRKAIANCDKATAIVEEFWQQPRPRGSAIRLFLPLQFKPDLIALITTVLRDPRPAPPASPAGDQLKKETDMDETREHIMQFFAHEHLPEHLRAVSREFERVANNLVETLPRNPERTVALRKLLEAKDAAVRARLAK